MNEKILSHLLAEFQEEIDGNAFALRQGAAKDFAEYKHLCGVIQGLSLAQSIVKALADKLENFDE
jgi:hypothetical protein